MSALPFAARSLIRQPARALLGVAGIAAIGALLLDRDDPSRVIGALRDPLLVPAEDEREGYVPNVVYSCGAMLNGNDLLLPYGLSDAAVGVAVISVPDLLAELQGSASA